MPNPTAKADVVTPTVEPSTSLQPREERAPVPVSLGLMPTSIEEGWRLAQWMAKSTLVPKGFQEKPHDILVAIQLGVEVGFAPMQALQSIAVINGRPSIWGDGFLALIMSSPLYVDHQEYYEVNGEIAAGLMPEDLKKDTTAAVCTFWRRGKSTPTTQYFTVGMARKANLLGKAGPWQEYPDRMLKMRARSWAGRDAFPDLLRGMRTAEEAHDEVTAGPSSTPPTPPTPIAPRRIDAPSTPSAPPSTPSTPPTSTPTPAPPSPPKPPSSELTADDIFKK